MTAPRDVAPATTPGPAAVVLRHPTEEDQPRIAAVIDWWFGGQHVRHLVVRSWFRHFGSTSWLALGGDAPEAGPVGVLIGHGSPDRPAEAIIHLVAVDPNQRRRGIGRALVEAFVAEAARSGRTVGRAVAWPGEPGATSFFRAMGFSPDAGPGSRNLYGTPAFADYEGAGEDRIVFVRDLPTPG